MRSGWRILVIPGARFTLRAAGASVVPVPVDANGLDVEAARKLAPTAKLGYVTPANQFPLGVRMSLDRRLALLNWAVNAGALIIEDEYDAAYRYFGRPVAALQTLDRSGCVVYNGTFTKMLFNALRLGFLVVPERLVNAFEVTRSFVDRHPHSRSGDPRGVHSRGALWTPRAQNAADLCRSVLREAAWKHLSGLIDIVDPAAGMRTIGWLKTSATDTTIARRGRSLGLE